MNDFKSGRAVKPDMCDFDRFSEKEYYPFIIEQDKQVQIVLSSNELECFTY